MFSLVPPFFLPQSIESVVFTYKAIVNIVFVHIPKQFYSSYFLFHRIVDCSLAHVLDPTANLPSRTISF